MPTLIEGRATRRCARLKRRLAQEHGRERGKGSLGRRKDEDGWREPIRERKNVVRVTHTRQWREEGESKGLPGRRKREKRNPSARKVGRGREDIRSNRYGDTSVGREQDKREEISDG